MILLIDGLHHTWHRLFLLLLQGLLRNDILSQKLILIHILMRLILLPGILTLFLIRNSKPLVNHLPQLLQQVHKESIINAHYPPFTPSMNNQFEIQIWLVLWQEGVKLHTVVVQNYVSVINWLNANDEEKWRICLTSYVILSPSIKLWKLPNGKFFQKVLSLPSSGVWIYVDL